MKKFFILAVSFVVLFSSCKKEKSNNDYHVSFNVEGVSKKFTGYTFAHIDSAGGDVELTILGARTTTSYDDYLGIYINNFPGGGNIPAGEYRDNSANFTVLTTFQNLTNGNEYEAGQTVNDDATQNNITITNHFKVTITSIDGRTARGTFSGDYFKDGDPTGNKVSITNGDFYVKFQ
jgi:hypothetical protein